MKKRKFTKIAILIFMIICILTSSNNVYASGNIFDTSQLGGDLNKFVGNTYTVTGFSSVINNIVKVISTIGSIISVIVLIVMGLKFITGSLEEKAEYKQRFIPYAIGAIFVFGISFITNLIFNLANDIF